MFDVGVDVGVDIGIAWITLNRPNRMNRSMEHSQQPRPFRVVLEMTWDGWMEMNARMPGCHNGWDEWVVACNEVLRLLCCCPFFPVSCSIIWPMPYEIKHAVERANRDDHVTAIVITGAGTNMEGSTAGVTVMGTRRAWG